MWWLLEIYTMGSCSVMGLLHGFKVPCVGTSKLLQLGMFQIPRALGGSTKYKPQFRTLILLWCRNQSPKTDPFFGSSQGAGLGAPDLGRVIYPAYCPHLFDSGILGTIEIHEALSTLPLKAVDGRGRYPRCTSEA